MAPVNPTREGEYTTYVEEERTDEITGLDTVDSD